MKTTGAHGSHQIIIQAERRRKEGDVLITLIEPVASEMIPESTHGPNDPQES